MAIIKYKVIKKNLEAVINYAKNGEKTENGILVSGLNCLPETAYTQMELTKKAFHKEGGRLGYHIIQSFNGNEIPPEKCNQIGMELARQLWGDKYQVIVCTHTNKKNVHNHIILNSVSFVDGSKYHNSNVEIALLRQTSDDLCIKNGLSIVTTKKASKLKDINRSRISNYNNTSEKMQIIKEDVDDAIKNSRKYEDFKVNLMKKGYLIKDSGKYFTVKSPYYERNIRLQRAFGEEYSYDSIKDRIYYKGKYKKDKVYVKKIYTGPSVDKLKLKYSSFYRLYVHYLYVLGKLPPKVHYEIRTKEYYKQVNQLERYSNQLRIIARYNINSLDEVKDLKNKFAEELVPLKGEREKLWREYNKKDTLNKFLIEENIKQLTEKINKLNFDIKTCNDLISNFVKSRKEVADIEKRRNEHIAENLKQRKIEKNRFR